MFQWDQPGIDTCIPSWPSLPGWQGVLCYHAVYREQPLCCCHLPPLRIYWSGEISCVWGHSRSLPRTQIYTDTLHLPPVLFPLSIKPTPLRVGCCPTSPDCFQPTSNKSVPPWVPRGFSAKCVLPSLHTGLGCSDGAKHSSVLGNMLNNAHWKLSCVHSIFHKACSVNCRAVWVQSAIQQRLVKIPMDASQRGERSISLDP